MFSRPALATGLLLLMPALVVALASPGPVGEGGQDLARLEREATARAQQVALAGGPSALSAEIARELNTIGQYEDFYLVGDYAPAFRNFPAETAAAFRSVDVEIQYNLLLWSWRRFSFPAMAPVLKALYQAPPEDYAKMRDLALRRFFDLAPDQARPFMLEELQRSDLRVSMTTLGRLGNAAFPEFEPAWLRNLEHGILDERVDAAVRIERFGSAAILDGVRRLYEAGASSWSCDVRSAVLGYLARVDRAGSAPLVRQALAALAPPDPQRGGRGGVEAGDDCRESYLRSDQLRPPLLARAPWPARPVILVSGPVPGDEQRIEYTIGDQRYRSTEELISRVAQMPSGSTIAWTYESGTASTHLERWPAADRDALFARVQRLASAHNVRVEQ